MRFASTIVLLVLSCALWSQDIVTLSKRNCDCAGAVEIKDTIIGPVISPEGFGEVLEIHGKPAQDPMWFEQEHNTVWYKFTATHSSELAIDIIPVRDEDDFDFLLFQSNMPGFCYDVDDGLYEPIRTNISRVNTEMNGQTGLSFTATDDFVAAGPGSPYSRSISVEQGDTYYLIIDNPHRANEGHTVVLRYKDQPSDTRRRRTDDSTEVVKEDPRTVMVLVQDENGDSLAADLSIDGIEYGGYVTADQVSTYYFQSDRAYKTFTINASREGYMLSVSKCTASKDTTTHIIKLQPIQVGQTVALNDIKFVGDEATILKTSEDALQQLVDFMISNPSVSIEIKGHVNGPWEKNKKVFKTLSTDRAEAVYNHLVLAGIDKKRMKYKGYGNTQMIYEEPATDQQQEANRRVEIEIIKH